MYNNPLENLRPEEVIMYLRKSRADDPTLSVAEVLSKHEERLDEWVKNNLSAPIPVENRFKEIVSGGDSIEERPEFQKVLKLIESPRYRAVLVVEIARLGRPDTMEIGRISKIFQHTQTLVLTPSRTFNVADKFEREMFEQELKIGQYYLETVKTLLRVGREASVKRGCYVCSKPLYGYDKITIMDGKRKCPTLAINEEQANIVRMVFDTYVNENVGTQVIANRLNEMGVTPPEIGYWSATTIRHMLENPTYIGMVRFNARKATLVVDDGEFRRTRLKTKDEERILVKGLHEAIISEDVFNAAKEKRGKAHKTTANKELRNPLASMLYCECGRAMSFRWDPKDFRNNKPARLACNGQRLCGNGSCSVPELIEFIVDILKQKISEYEVEAKKGNAESNAIHEKQIKFLEKKLTDIGNKEVALWEAQLDTENRMPQHIFQSLTDKLLKEREDTEKALSKTRELLSAPIDYEIKIVTLQKALDALLDDEVSVAEKNKFLKACINRVTYHRAPAQPMSGMRGPGWIHSPIDIDVEMKI